MDWKLLDDSGSECTWLLVYATGDEVLTELSEFARDQKLDGTRLTAIGAFRGLTVGWFDWERKECRLHHNPGAGRGTHVGRRRWRARTASPRSTRTWWSARPTGGARRPPDVGDGPPDARAGAHPVPAHLSKRVDPEAGIALISLD